jgi:hypothetical protein
VTNDWIKNKAKIQLTEKLLRWKVVMTFNLTGYLEVDTKIIL